jgi:carboxyl-terminal processing protease
LLLFGFEIPLPVADDRHGDDCMKARFYLHCLAALALAALPPSARAAEDFNTTLERPLPPPASTLFALSPDPTDASIAYWTAGAITNYQFTQHPFDAEISGRFLDRYLETLDYFHLFFLQPDLKEFEAYRSNLQVYTLAKHDISPAYVIFSRFLERAAQREAYETNVLQNEHFEFTGHERFTPDRHELPNPKDMAEATNLWRQEVRLEYLDEKLAQKVAYFGPVTFDAQSNLVIALARKTTNSYSFEFLPGKFQDQQGHEFGRLDGFNNEATNATIHLQIPPGGNLLKITNHFFGQGGTDLGLIRFERASNTNNGAAPPDLASANEYESVIELETNDTARIVRSLQKRYVQILRNYCGLTNDSHVLEAYLTALARAYDPHSDYFGRAEADNFKIKMQLSLIGIGARLVKTDSDRCQIESLIPGGPAEQSGLLKSKDIIVAVAQKDQEPVPVDGMPLEEVVEKIRGPEGTPVTLTIERESSVRPKVITLIRNKVKLVEEESKATLFDAPPRIGVIDVPSFYAETDSDPSALGPPHEKKTVTTDVAALIYRLKREKVEGIILDLRTNGGGYLDEAIRLTGLFTSKGPVVMTKSPDGLFVTENSTNAAPLYDGPLIVLTSRMSASASEILAGALQDYGRALIVGDKTTFGKGTVQTVQPLASFIPRLRAAPSQNLGSLHLTIKKFYRASGLTTESNGVAADIVLPSILNYANFSESSQPNWLPADTVGGADLPPNLNLVKPYLPELLKRSLERREKNRDFAYLQEDIDEYRKRQDDKSLSLNEAERRTEQRDKEARLEARKKERASRPKPDEKFYELTLKNVDQPELTLYKPNPKPAPDENADPEDADAGPEDPVTSDLILTEARHIMADYISLMNKPLAAAAGQ